LRGRVEHMSYLTQGNVMFSFTSTCCSLKLIECFIIELKYWIVMVPYE
jgi:hypothetical protein